MSLPKAPHFILFLSVFFFSPLPTHASESEEEIIIEKAPIPKFRYADGIWKSVDDSFKTGGSDTPYADKLTISFEAKITEIGNLLIGNCDAETALFFWYLPGIREGKMALKDFTMDQNLPFVNKAEKVSFAIILQDKDRRLEENMRVLKEKMTEVKMNLPLMDQKIEKKVSSKKTMEKNLAVLQSKKDLKNKLRVLYTKHSEQIEKTKKNLLEEEEEDGGDKSDSEEENFIIRKKG